MDTKKKLEFGVQQIIFKVDKNRETLFTLFFLFEFSSQNFFSKKLFLISFRFIKIRENLLTFLTIFFSSSKLRNNS